MILFAKAPYSRTTDAFAASGFKEAAREIRRKTRSKIIVLTLFENPSTVIEASKKCFASEYVFKSQFDLIPEAIWKTAAGHTPQEYLIRSLILSELTPCQSTYREFWPSVEKYYYLTRCFCAIRPLSSKWLVSVRKIAESLLTLRDSAIF